MPPVVLITLTGPATVVASTTSTNFTMTPQVPFTGGFHLIDSGAGGTFTPADVSWVADATPMTFVYNAPAALGVKNITPYPHAGTANFSVMPSPIQITVVSATTTPQHIYQMPQVGGVPPFQILLTNDQIPAAAVPFVSVPQHLYQFPQISLLPPFGILITNNQIPAAIIPPVIPPSTTTYGSEEAGTGIITALAAGDSVIIMGPIQLPYRSALREVINVQANGPFNLDYQFTTDFGTTWYTGRQIASATTGADGTAYTNKAHAKLDPGWFYRIIIYNSGGSTINAVFDKRLISKGSWGT